MCVEDFRCMSEEQFIACMRAIKENDFCKDYMQIFQFHNPLETKGFLTFPRGVPLENRSGMGQKYSAMV